MNKAKWVILSWSIILVTALVLAVQYNNLHQENLRLAKELRRSRFPFVYQNMEIRNGAFRNAKFNNITARSSIFEDCTIYNCKLIDCVTINCTISTCIIIEGEHVPSWYYREIFQEPTFYSDGFGDITNIKIEPPIGDDCYGCIPLSYRPSYLTYCKVNP